MALYAKHNQINFAVGDTIKIKQKIVEGKKERLQAFVGLVIAIGGKENEKNFVIRKISEGIGVERIIPLDSPLLDSVEIVKKGKVRRSKLYYLRTRTGRLALKVKQDFGTGKDNGKKPITKPSEKPEKPAKPEAKSGETGGEAGAEAASE